MHQFIAVVATIPLIAGPENNILPKKGLRYPGAEFTGLTTWT
jgi:hypothetical protein